MNNKKKKYLFMDMDGTVCHSKQQIMKDTLDYLQFLKMNGVIIHVISGAKLPQMMDQLRPLECILMPQSGNVMPKWRNLLSKAEQVEIYAHIAKVKVRFPHLFDISRKDHVDNRGSLTALSFTGHGAEYATKINFDPKCIKRLEVLREVPFKSKTLDCQIAGTTCLDYTKKNGRKGDNIKKYIEMFKIDKKDCIYFGDALFPGGNDASVVGVIDTVEVSGPTTLLSKLRKIYGRQNIL